MDQPSAPLLQPSIFPNSASILVASIDLRRDRFPDHSTLVATLEDHGFYCPNFEEACDKARDPKYIIAAQWYCGLSEKDYHWCSHR